MSKTENQVDTLNIKAIYSPNQQDEYLLALLASETKEEGLQYQDAENKWNTFRIAATGLIELSPDWKLNTLAWYQTNDMQTQNASIQVIAWQLQIMAHRLSARRKKRNTTVSVHQSQQIRNGTDGKILNLALTIARLKSKTH